MFSLDDIQRDHPNVLRHALYWICRAKLAENVGDHERVVCMLEQASSFSAQVLEKVLYFNLVFGCDLRLVAILMAISGL